jgi:hypothetical protein
MVTMPFAWHSSKISFAGIAKMKLNAGRSHPVARGPDLQIASANMACT